MSTKIRIKRSGITPVPNLLAAGELAYSWETSTKGKLYIGWGDELTPGVASNIAAIGGKYYTDLVSERISHTPGTLLPNTAIIVDGDSTINRIKVGNLDLSGSTITSTSSDSDIIINPNGTGKTIISDIYVNNDATSLSEYIESVAGGAIIAGDGLLSTPGNGTNGADIGSTILSVKVDGTSIFIDTDVLEIKEGGIQNIHIAESTIANSKLVNSSITFGADVINLGDTVSLLTLTTIDAGSIKITGNAISSTTGDINITPLAGNDVSITATGLGNISLSVTSGQEITLSTLAVTDLTTLAITNGLVVAGTSGALQTSADLTFNGTTLDLNGTLEVGNISITENTIISTNANGNIVLSPNGTGETRGTVDVNSTRISNVGSPTAGTDAANKQYVDDVAQGLKILPQALAFSNIDLSATYDNGTAGVGATLTSTSNVTFPDVDGIAIALNDNVIINGQNNKAQNGSYILTTVGSAGTPWVLTRAPFIDQASEIEGSFEFVTSGTEFGNTGWVLTSLTEPVVVGTTELTWVQFSGAGTYLAGAGLALTGNSFSVLVDNSSIEIDVDTLRVKAGGITNDMLAGLIANEKLVNSKIVIKDQNAVTDDVSLGDTLTFTVGTGTGITTAVTANTVTISGIDASETVKGVASFNATHFTVDNGAVSLDTEGVQDIVLLAIEATADTGISVTYNDDPNNKLAIAGINASTTVKGVATFGGYTSTIFDTINNVDTGVEITSSPRQFSVDTGNVRVVALDGGSF